MALPLGLGASADLALRFVVGLGFSTGPLSDPLVASCCIAILIAAAQKCKVKEVHGGESGLLFPLTQGSRIGPYVVDESVC
jgi:hypothetical protein